MSSAKRIEWIDISKFIAISIMVMGHLGLPKSVSHMIHIFHMPVFFILSGYCFNEIKHKNFLLFLKSRTKSILVPYLFWGIVMYVIYFLVPYYQTLGEYVSPLKFLKAIVTQDANIVLFSGFGVIQWFLTALFFSEIILWIFAFLRAKISAKNRYLEFVFLFLSLIVLDYFTGILNIPNYLGVRSSLLGALFCIIGFEYKKIRPQEFKWKNINFVPVGIICVAMLMVSWKFNGIVNMRLAQYNNDLLFIFGALSGSSIVFIVSMLAEKIYNADLSRREKNGKTSGSLITVIYKAALLLGQNTIIILCFNRLVQYSGVLLLNNLLQMFMDIEAGIGLYIRQVLGFVLEMLLFIPIILFVTKLLPFSIGRKYPKKKGGIA